MPAPDPDLRVRPATLADLDALAPLFDAYRVFYAQPSDPARARHFLRERLERGESEVLLAFDGARAVGFTQLYPMFTSVSTARLYVLNDLFVAPEGRRRGAGRALLAAAAAHARTRGAVRLVLSTARTNVAGQALYESAGWQRDDAFLVYELALDGPV